MSNIGENIKKLREQNGFTQQELANMIKTGKNYISAIEIVPHPIDIDRIIAAVRSEKKRVLLNLMYIAGLRWGEASQLQWKNIDLATRVIKLDESETAEDQLVPIPEELLPWFEANKGVGWVFPSERTGLPYTDRMKTAIEGAAKRVRLKPFGVHTFRHASASYLYAATDDIKAVQEHLRHKNISTTANIYTHVTVAKKAQGQRALVSHLDKLRGKVFQSDNSKKAKTSK